MAIRVSSYVYINPCSVSTINHTGPPNNYIYKRTGSFVQHTTIYM